MFLLKLQFLGHQKSSLYIWYICLPVISSILPLSLACLVLAQFIKYFFRFCTDLFLSILDFIHISIVLITAVSRGKHSYTTL